MGRQAWEGTYLSCKFVVDAASQGFLGLDKLILEGLSEHFAVSYCGILLCDERN